MVKVAPIPAFRGQVLCNRKNAAQALADFSPEYLDTIITGLKKVRTVLEEYTPDDLVLEMTPGAVVQQDNSGAATKNIQLFTLYITNPKREINDNDYRQCNKFYDKFECKNLDAYFLNERKALYKRVEKYNHTATQKDLEDWFDDYCQRAIDHYRHLPPPQSPPVMGKVGEIFKSLA